MIVFKKIQLKEKGVVDNNLQPLLPLDNPDYIYINDKNYLNATPEEKQKQIESFQKFLDENKKLNFGL